MAENTSQRIRLHNKVREVPRMVQNDKKIAIKKHENLSLNTVVKPTVLYTSEQH